jgi:hypothetical protein
MWYEVLRAGYSLEDMRVVNALKLSNILQLDRFEEDLLINRVRLRSPPPPQAIPPPRSALNPGGMLHHFACL